MALSFIFWSLFVLGRLCTAQNTSLPYNFTLAALNTSQALPNSNLTGAPLVLGQSGQTNGIVFYVTSTYASFPYNDYPYMRLSNGNLRAYRDDADESWGANATTVKSGGTLGWISSQMYPTNIRDYSSVTVPGQSQYSLLAFDGFYNLWSLCPFSSGQVNVVFNVSGTAQGDGYDARECYSVQINIVQINIT